MNTQREELRAALRALGFDEVRFVRVEPVDGRFLRDWLADGLHADMAWMARTADKRLDPAQVLPGARTAVVLGVNYWSGEKARAASEPSWARYAVYSDYHDTIGPALAEAGRRIESVCGVGRGAYRYYTDTGPVLERGWAARAGIGFVGKNGMLISRRHGNWLLLGMILTTLDLEPDVEPADAGGSAQEIGRYCGKCRRCIDACPTRAIVRPGVVDARLCIAYQTIENRGVIPRDLRAAIGRRVFGCDTCLEVCPWNRFAERSRRVLLESREELRALSIRDLLSLTPERFAAIFRGTPIKRVKLAGLLRNACIAAGNTGSREWAADVVRLAGHPSALVRAHAVWAAYRLLDAPEAGAQLAGCRSGETDPQVLAEYAAEEPVPSHPKLHRPD